MRISVGDRRLFVEVMGSRLIPDGPQMREKPVLILVHGGPGHDHSVYRTWFDQLSDVAQVIYFDLSAHGRSDPAPPDAWNLDSWAHDIPALCHALGIEHPIVFGHSVGGMVAMTYGVNYPEHPGALILSATYGRQRLDRSEAVFRRLGGETAARAAVDYFSEPSPVRMAAFVRHCLPLYALDMTDTEAGQRIRLRPDIADHFFAGEAKRLDILERLSRIRCPTLVLGGDDDPVCTAADVKDIAAALPPELVTHHAFPGCRHGLWADAGPEYFARLRAFIAALPPQRLRERPPAEI